MASQASFTSRWTGVSEILIIDPKTLEKTVVPAAYRTEYTKGAAAGNAIEIITATE